MRVLKFNKRAEEPATTPPANQIDRVVYLFHHCVAREDELNQFGGWTASPLTELGLKQAQEMVGYLAANGVVIDRLWSSDLPRATETAHFLIPLTTSKSCVYTEKARSWGIGDAISGESKDNQLFRDLKKFYVEHPDNVPPGDNAESLNQSKSRWLQFLMFVFSITEPGTPNGIVCHGNNIKNSSQVLGFGRLKVGHGAVCRLTLNEKEMSLEVLYSPEGAEIGQEDDDIRKVLASGQAYRCARK